MNILMVEGNDMSLKKILVLLVISFSLAILAVSPLPSIGPCTEVHLPAQPTCIEDIAVDSHGNLWLADRLSGAVACYSGDGKLLKRLGTEGEEKLEHPTRLSVCDERIAAADGNQAVKMFGLDGRPMGQFATPTFDPVSGILLTPKRMVFTGQGFQGFRPDPSKAYISMTLFSTDFKGRELKVARETKVNPGESAAFDMFAHGFSASWPGNGHWVVCRELPRKVLVVDEAGQIEEESNERGVLPSFPESILSDRVKVLQAVWDIPHVVGLIPSGPLLGVIWQRPPSSGSQLAVEWMDQRMNFLGETPLALPQPLGPMAFVRGVAVTPDGWLYVTVVQREIMDPGKSKIFRAKLYRPGGKGL